MTPRTLLALSLLSCAACARPLPRPAAMTADAYPGALRDSGDLPDGLFLEQRIDARFGERRLSFRAVVQTDAGTLRLLALSSFGTRAFLIEQRGQAIAFTSYVDQPLPFPPRFILLDLHRTLFWGAPSAAPAAAERRWVEQGEEIIERWAGGQLQERRFRRVDGDPQGEIVIRYHDGGLAAVGKPPARIELDNGWFGYALRITAVPSSAR